MKGFQVDMGTELAKKTDKLDLQKVWEQFNKYAMYQDLKDLYNKVLPPLSTFEAKMDEMSASYEQSKEMIRRYDEVISDKANKTAIKEIYEVMRNYPRNEKIKEIQGGFQKQVDGLKEEMETINSTLKFVSDNINKDIHTAVRRATASLKAQMTQSQSMQAGPNGEGG